MILEQMSDLNLSLGEFLYEVFRVKDVAKTPSSRDQRHESFVAKFLKGQSTYSLGDIVRLIMQHRSAQASRGSNAWNDRFSFTKPSCDITMAEPYMTTFALELVGKRLLSEMRNVARGSSGLHGSSRGGKGRAKLHWSDISPMTVETVAKVFREKAPLTSYIMLQLASPRPTANQYGDRATRSTQRPPELVRPELISTAHQVEGFCVAGSNRNPCHTCIFPHPACTNSSRCKSDSVLCVWSTRNVVPI